MADLTKHFKQGVAEVKSSSILNFAKYTSQYPDIVKFTVGEPDFNTPDHIKTAAIKGIVDNHSHYAPSNGTPGLRKAAADFLARHYDMHYEPSEIIATNGATEAIYTVMSAIINPGDVMVLPTPIFPLYIADASLEKAEVVQIDTSQTGFKLMPDQLQAAVDEYGDRLRILVMNYPTNPTGVMYSQEELDALAAVIKDRPTFVLCDEIYSELNYEQEHASMAKSLRSQAIVLNGVSKSWAMTGYRIGIMAAPQEITDQLAKVHQFITTTEPTPMQDAAEEAFKNRDRDAREMKAAFKERRDYLYQALTETGFEVIKPQGAFYIWAKIPAGLNQKDMEFVYELADQAHVGVCAGSWFAKGGQGWLRFSYATALDEIKEGVSRIKKFVEENKNDGK
ncbi:aminotransferase class I/II-fold pyridoxal phosphate-dependent enzyme [Lactobacillus delbrueckii]|uniref:aminotransferase class I/II-fold pyridoxal phosphate-dependent enzyme n=1 Tax=Lactobacillus delbrueckii TaxID=1584 RepID=UPI0021A338CA|nr:aminotransferase class I/II-fold pyridoxal phosphate-dependent enzyme [Lactobacillus delbrueckii]MCT2878109.1 aminotransferase class I/II-fold pyridoxal phosphate-dependent enzyme [Lactobacillus delbrueckii]MCT3492595.1 aminotransferase class I/II-fold pyridoxal phosphate-dependent enzyme [Lactobacillus delbrueckii]